jgi:hypothetical protein
MYLFLEFQVEIFPFAFPLFFLRFLEMRLHLTFLYKQVFLYELGEGLDYRVFLEIFLTFHGLL